MWFGTQNGLTRYDGVNFVVYENIPNDPNSLLYNNVSCLYEDKNKRLWVGTFTGLNLYNREKNSFILISGLQNIVISSICEDDENHLWLGTIGNRLIKYNLLNKKIEYFNSNSNDISSKNSDHITCILVDKNKRLWAGSWNGLYLLDLNGKVIKHFAIEPRNPESLSDNYVNALTIEKDSILWIGTLYGGLNRLSINDINYKFKHYLDKFENNSPPSILCLLADKGNRLWIGTENKGLLKFDTHSNKLEHYTREEGNPYTLNSNTIRALFVDNLNILWVGTLGKGVNLMDDRFNRFEIYKKNPNTKNTICGEDARCFIEDKHGNVWISTYDGICKFTIKNRQFQKLLDKEKGGLTTNAVNSIVFDSDENLWVGTLNEGVDCFDKNLVKIGNYKIRGIQKVGEDKINLLYADKSGNVWVGTSGSGLFKYNKSKKTFEQVFDESQGVGPNDFGYVMSIRETSDSDLWVGTAYRLFCLKNIGNNKYSYKIFASNSSQKRLHSNYIVSLLEDHNKNLWVGSLDKGLFLYNKNDDSFISFTKQDGLPSNSILGILEDNDKNLWISTTKGIAKFNIASNRFINFTAEDGLVSDEFNQNSCLSSKEGMFFFGSNEGFNCFYPSKIKNNTSVQSVCLTGFKLFNQSVPIGTKGSPLTKSISETRRIVLQYSQSSFSLDFVALNYIQGSKSRYMYILEGLEDKWNEVENKNSASYNYVKPGEYVFKVKGSNNDGVWNNIPATLEIIILPPFWQSKWAYLIYFLVFIAAIYAIIRYRVARAKQIHLLELNQMKLQFFANISHELRTPLSLIISPVESLLAYASKNKEIKGQLEMIYKNANRLFRLVNEIMDFHKAVESKLPVFVQRGDIVKFTKELSSFFSDEALRRNITYKFEADPIIIEAWFDRDKYEKIILNLLSNAFKFTQDSGAISIRIEKIVAGNVQMVKGKYNNEATSRELLKLSIVDNGKGIPSEGLNRIFERFYQGNNGDNTYQAGTGIGLSLTKTLVELHHGEIFVTSEKGKETCFTILMPLGKDHFSESEIVTEPIDISSAIQKTQLINEDAKNNEPKLLHATSTILLVEDNFELRKYIASTLSSKYKIIEASDGDIGCKLAIENIPDLIISDIIMPLVSGIELCKQMKENIITSHIPIVLLTAKTTLEDKISGIETGADAYVTKPFNIRHLEAIIKNLIETRKRLFQRFSQDVYILPKEMSGNQLDQDFLGKIIKYVEENITSAELSVEDLASQLLMSPGHIWRKVKSLTGLSTNEFIRVIRLKKAIKLMEESDLNISEIAYKVGFSSPAYFTKCFREQYGKSPSTFKRKN